MTSEYCELTEGTMDVLNLALNKMDREREQKEPLPSLLCYEHTFRSAKYWLHWGNISVILNRMIGLSVSYISEQALMGQKIKFDLLTAVLQILNKLLTLRIRMSIRLISTPSFEYL
jgi:hypothetical protein